MPVVFLRFHLFTVFVCGTLLSLCLASFYDFVHMNRTTTFCQATVRLAWRVQASAFDIKKKARFLKTALGKLTCLPWATYEE